jgi:hypothetical protein
MIDSDRYKLDTIFLLVISKFAVPTTVIVGSLSSELTSVFQYQFPQRAEQQIYPSVDRLQLAVLGIDLGGP